MSLQACDTLPGPYANNITQGKMPGIKVTVLKDQERLIPLSEIAAMSVPAFTKLYSVGVAHLPKLTILVSTCCAAQLLVLVCKHSVTSHDFLALERPSSTLLYLHSNP